MADLSNPLTQVVVGQAQPAVTVNNLFDAASPATLYGQNDLTTSGLTWGYYGGRFRGNAIAHGTILLPASQASVYIVAAVATGVVSQSTATTNWNDSTNYMRLFLATTDVSTITDWDDYREWLSSAAAGTAADTELIQDIVGALIVAGSGISVNYNDGDSPPTFSITATGSAGALTQENVEDIAASLITVGAGLSRQYNDGDSPATLALTLTRAPSIQTVASAATVTPTFSDDIVLITAQAAGLTLANPTGTAIDGLGLVIRIKDNGTARSITYGTQYRAIGITLPTTTVISKTLYLALIFNSTDTKWDVLAVGQES